jgi:hypothetical protein
MHIRERFHVILAEITGLYYSLLDSSRERLFPGSETPCETRSETAPNFGEGHRSQRGAAFAGSWTSHLKGAIIRKRVRY